MIFADILRHVLWIYGAVHRTDNFFVICEKNIYRYKDPGCMGIIMTVKITSKIYKNNNNNTDKYINADN